MKTVLCITLTLLSIHLFSACNGASSHAPVGQWTLESISGKEATEREKASIIEFGEDGSLTRKDGEEIEKEGKWRIEEKEGKQVLLFINKRGNIDEESEIKELNGTTFIFINKDKEIKLKRK